jgi:hypothetical protein
MPGQSGTGKSPYPRPRAIGNRRRAPKKKLGAFLERIKQILKDDQAMLRKQRHTAKRIWERLRDVRGSSWPVSRRTVGNPPADF